MSQTAPTPVTALPTAPSTSNPSTFASLADAFIAALATFVSQVNAIATNVYNNAVDCYNNAVTAATAESNAAASATAAASAASAAAWVNGGTYALNVTAISQINFQTYRKITASSVTTIDPANDPTNWVSTNGTLTPVAVTASGTCIANTLEECAAAAAITRTIPAGLAVGARIGFKDAGQMFATNNLTITPPSGHRIEDQAVDETLVVSTNYINFELRQTAAGIWRIF